VFRVGANVQPDDGLNRRQFPLRIPMGSEQGDNIIRVIESHMKQARPDTCRICDSIRKLVDSPA
jgi:hypothetical protein